MKSRIAEPFFAIARKFPQKIALRDGHEALTYEQLERRIRALSAQLSGAHPSGTVVLNFCENTVASLIAHFAILDARLCVVPLEPQVSLAQLNSIVRDAGARAAVISTTCLAERADRDRLLMILVDAGVTTVSPAADSFAGTLPPVRNDVDFRDGAPEIATIMYTTGTTGAPKGVRLSHRNVMWSTKNIMDFIGYTSEDSELIALPISHNFGLGHVYCNLFSGGSIILEKGFLKVGRLMDALREFHPTGFPGTPASYALLCDRYSDLFRERASSLRFIVINSAPLRPELARRIQDSFPQARLMVYYGLTEASRSTFHVLTDSPTGLWASVGRPMHGVSVEIRNDAGCPCAADEKGEVFIRGENVTAGYTDAARNAEAFEGPWLKTADIGRLDADGYLFILGRRKNVINVGGYKFLPDDGENLLLQREELADCAIVGVPGLDTEIPVAAVVLKPGHTMQASGWISHLSASLESYKVPRTYVSFESLPRASSGKLLVEQLRSQIIDRMGKKTDA